MIRIVSGVIAGAAIGWAVTAGHYQDKLAQIETQQKDAQDERTLAFSKAAQHWQKLLDDANFKPADIERVFVKTSCVPAGGSAGMDDGAGGTRTELAGTAVESLAGVISHAESKYRACTHRLRAFQEMYHKE